jgi:hypothetical protein
MELIGAILTELRARKEFRLGGSGHVTEWRTSTKSQQSNMVNAGHDQVCSESCNEQKQPVPIDTILKFSLWGLWRPLVAIRDLRNYNFGAEPPYPRNKYGVDWCDINRATGPKRNPFRRVWARHGTAHLH